MQSEASPNLCEFARNLRAIIQKDKPIKIAIVFVLGRSYGLSAKTQAGMAARSEGHLNRMRLLVKKESMRDAIATVDGVSTLSPSRPPAADPNYPYVSNFV